MDDKKFYARGPSMNNIYDILEKFNTVFENQEKGNGMVRFHVNSEKAYQAVMDQFGDVVEWDADTDAMMVPENTWPKVEQVAHDADGEGASQDTGVNENYLPGNFEPKNISTVLNKTGDVPHPTKNHFVGDSYEHEDQSPVYQAVMRRIMNAHSDLLKKYGVKAVEQAVADIADYVGDTDEIGTSDVSAWTSWVVDRLGSAQEEQQKVLEKKDIASSTRTDRMLAQMRLRNPQAKNDLEALILDFEKQQRQDRRDINTLYREIESEDEQIERIEQELEQLKKNRR